MSIRSNVTITKTDGVELISKRYEAPHSPEIIGAQLRETLKMIGMEYVWTVGSEDGPIPVGGRLVLSTPTFTVYVERVL